MKVKSESEVTQSYPTLSDPMDCSLSGSSIHGIFQARVLEWGDLGSIPGWERSPGEGKGYPLQCSDLENSMDCIVHGDAKSRTRLSDFHFTVEYKNYKTSNCNAVHLKYIVIIIDRQNKWMVMEIPPIWGAVGIDWEGRSEFWAVLEMFCVLIWVPKLQVSKTL